jgi:pterin-4a-carbinolamine dehydratase
MFDDSELNQSIINNSSASASITSSATVTGYCCDLCKKSYTRKSSLDKHKLLCDYKSKSKLEHKVEEEELGDTPTYEQLVKIVQELAFKYVKLEEKMSEMQVWVSQKKQKIKVIDWLNEHVNATIGFKEWTTTIKVTSQIALSLIDYNAFQIFQSVLEYNLLNAADFICPIKCFSQKQNVFYVCEKTPEGKSVWTQMETDELLQILKKIQSKLLSELSKWKLDNKTNIETDDKLSEQFNKALIKLLNITIVAHDVNVNRIRSNLYSFLKMDLKNLIEYEFHL